jgi:hypothetical protein
MQSVAFFTEPRVAMSLGCYTRSIGSQTMSITLAVLRHNVPVISDHPTVTDAAECGAFLADDDLAVPLFIRDGDEILWARTGPRSIWSFRDRVVAEASAVWPHTQPSADRRRHRLPAAAR